ECAVGCVVSRRDVTRTLLVHPLGNGCRSEALHRAHAAERVVQHITPVAEHVENNAAVVLFAIVPRRPLRGLPVALEDPVTELSAHGKNFAEEAAVDQSLKLA